MSTRIGIFVGLCTRIGIFVGLNTRLRSLMKMGISALNGLFHHRTYMHEDTEDG